MAESRLAVGKYLIAETGKQMHAPHGVTRLNSCGLRFLQSRDWRDRGRW